MDIGSRIDERPAFAEGSASGAALPVRWAADGSLEVLLVTTRTTGRWTVPKGWPIKGLKGYEAAAREAREEAGVVGKVCKKPVAEYLYWKRLADQQILCRVNLFRLRVERLLDSGWSGQNGSSMV